MATKALNPEKAEAILRDWRIGKLSIRDLADKHGVSRGKVGQLCKDIFKDAAIIVDAGVQYKQGLAEHDGLMVDAIEKAVHDQTKHIQFFNKAALRNVLVAVEKIGANTTQAEHRMCADTIRIGRETVLGRTPDTVINNTNAQQNQKHITYEVVR